MGVIISSIRLTSQFILIFLIFNKRVAFSSFTFTVVTLELPCLVFFRVCVICIYALIFRDIYNIRNVYLVNPYAIYPNGCKTGGVKLFSRSPPYPYLSPSCITPFTTLLTSIHVFFDQLLVRRFLSTILSFLLLFT